jgi:hypothetical protein
VKKIVNRLIDFRLMRAVLISCVAGLGPIGCRKAAMSSTDTIRTGNGDSLRFMVPVAVKQDDGSSAYCVYTARPSSEMDFFENLGPGRSDGATVVTKNAIPQGQFIQNLRDPEVMGDLGGLGNDIVNDLFTAGSAWMLASTGLIIGASGADFVRGKEFSEYRKEAQKVTARFLEADSIVASELKSSYDDLGKLLRQNGANKKSVDQFIRVLASANPSGRNPNFYANYFQKFASPSGQQSQELLSDLTRALSTPSQRAVKLSPGDISSLRTALSASQLGSQNSALLGKVIGRLTELEIAESNLIQNLQKIRQSLTSVGDAAKSRSGELPGVLARSRAILAGVAEDFGKSFGAGISGIFGNKNSLRLAKLANESSAKFWYGSGASTAAKEAAGRGGGLFSKKPIMDSQTAWNQLSDLTVDAGPAASGVADDAAVAAKSGGMKNFLANACLRGNSGAVRFAKMAICGLAVGAGSLGVKKVLFEPATEPIKQEQVAQSFEFSETVQEVNDITFRRLEATIGSFQSDPNSLSCQ